MNHLKTVFLKPSMETSGVRGAAILSRQSSLSIELISLFENGLVFHI